MAFEKKNTQVSVSLYLAAGIYFPPFEWYGRVIHAILEVSSVINEGTKVTTNVYFLRFSGMAAKC